MLSVFVLQAANGHLIVKAICLGKALNRAGADRGAVVLSAAQQLYGEDARQSETSRTRGLAAPQ